MKSLVKTTAVAQDSASEVDISVGDAAAHADSSSAVSPVPTLLRLDPAEVYPGSGPNRLPEAYESEEFAALSDSIMATRGNVTPISVCPLPTDEVPHGTQYKYLLISGSRRLRACLDNKVQVLALVGQHGTLPMEMVRMAEDQLREAPKPIELGRQLQVIVAKYPLLSKRSIARIMGRDSAQIERCLAIAALPAAIVECFASPTDIRTNDATPLKQALERAEAVVLAEAEKIRNGSPLKAAEVVKRLSDAAEAAAPPPAGKGKKRGDESFITPVLVDGEALGEMKQDKSGRQVITLDVALNDGQRQALNRQLERFVREKILGQKKPKKDAKATQPAADATPAEFAQGASA
jgi:ParB/RepB/Spo0J family partition protein